MDFIYNDGSSAHRGVWHLAEDIKAVEHPEETKTTTYEVIDWNKGVYPRNKVEGVQYDNPRSYSRYPEGTCSTCGIVQEKHQVVIPERGYYNYGHNYDEHRIYPILGVTTIIATIPAYVAYGGKAACGSGKFGGANIDLLDLYRIGKSKKYCGKTLKIVAGKVVDKFYRNQDTPPQPFCGHCLKRIEGADVFGLVEVSG